MVQCIHHPNLGCCANQINLASLSTPDARPRYQNCGTHPCTNWAQRIWIWAALRCVETSCRRSDLENPREWLQERLLHMGCLVLGYPQNKHGKCLGGAWLVLPLIAVILKLHKDCCYHGSPFPPAKIASYLVIFKPVFRRNMACSWGLKLHIKKKLCGIINVFHNIQPPKICCLQHQHVWVLQSVLYTFEVITA